MSWVLFHCVLSIVFTLLNSDKGIYRSQYEQNYKKSKEESFWLFTLVHHMIYCEWKVREWIPVWLFISLGLLLIHSVLGSLSSRPRYAGETWTALFFRIGLPSTLTRNENGAFRKHSPNRRNLKTPALLFSRNRKQFENKAFRKRRSYNNQDISLHKRFSNTNPKSPVIVAFFQFLRRSVGRKTFDTFSVN